LYTLPFAVYVPDAVSSLLEKVIGTHAVKRTSGPPAELTMRLRDTLSPFRDPTSSADVVVQTATFLRLSGGF
tara:strand:- start:396 stop:611 length:216 start_codon:yes stop_codon:yes gene_type:complete